MYIYELSFDINKELCRLLDNGDDWKELAGIHMQYSPFDINEIEQTARRLADSPTNILFMRWGQLNHYVKELFILLYKMKHVPAMRCLASLMDERYLRLLRKLEQRPSRSNNIDVNGNHRDKGSNGGSSSVPIPVILIGQGDTTSRLTDVSAHTNTQSDDSTSVNDSTTDIDSLPGVPNDGNITSENDIRQHISAIPVLKYEDLKEATGNWSDANLLGRGGFGQVYKGEWKLLTVAIKRLGNNNNNDATNRELIREMCLNQYRHDNILPLYGYSIGGPEACLVYQLMSGGSLEQRLRCKNFQPLTWSQRHRIAHGVARGLQFLHTMTTRPLIHGDIKPANILLDQCTIPKIGDFGLARKGPYGEQNTHMTVSKVHGTQVYLPNEYLSTRCLSPAVDVFSFGVVLLELATALPAADRARPMFLLTDFMHDRAKHVDLATLEDRHLTGAESSPPLCREVLALGLDCTRQARAERPTMLQVYKRLDAMRSAQ